MTDTAFDILQPQGWAPPRGYAHGIAAEGRQVFIAGQLGCTADARVVSGDFAAQVEQALKNIVAVLAEAGGRPHHLTKLNWYVTDMAAYMAARKEIGAAYRRVIGKHYPATTLVAVVALVDADAKVEIEATAVIAKGEG